MLVQIVCGRQVNVLPIVMAAVPPI